MKKSELKALIREVIEEISSQPRYTPKQIQTLKSLEFRWSRKDKMWYKKRDAITVPASIYMRIYFDEETSEYIWVYRYWSDEYQKFKEDYSRHETLEELLYDHFNTV